MNMHMSSRVIEANADTRGKTNPVPLFERLTVRFGYPVLIGLCLGLMLLGFVMNNENNFACLNSYTECTVR